jgi:hypothetical protein
MKLLLVALFALVAPAAHAITCSSAGRVDDGSKVYVTAPALVIGDGNIWAQFVAPTFRSGDFGDSLCKLCGYGQKSTALSFVKVGPGNVYAVLDSEGRLDRIGQVDVVSLAVDSLTCEY